METLTRSFLRSPKPNAPGRPHGRFDPMTRPLTLAIAPEHAGTGAVAAAIGRSRTPGVIMQDALLNAARIESERPAGHRRRSRRVDR